MKRLLALLLTIGVLVGVANSHNGMQHVMGTVTSITASNVTVKATDGSTQVVLLSTDTKYLKGTQVIAAKDIKVGDHVVIHATKKGDQLTAADAWGRWMPLATRFSAPGALELHLAWPGSSSARGLYRTCLCIRLSRNDRSRLDIHFFPQPRMRRKPSRRLDLSQMLCSSLCSLSGS